ncbi:MAG: ABC transporter permease [bacterium]|nr:ABC transporter permease [bacterium]
MKVLNTFKVSFVALRANKLRSILTILGIVIGITAIMVVMSVGQNAENMILGEVGGMGAEMIVIRPGKEPKGPTDIAGSLLSNSLKTRDVEALKNKNNVPYLEDVAPAVIVPGSVSYLGETYTPVIFGWVPDLMVKMFDIYADEGTFFTEADIKQKSNVVIIGAKVRKELFGDSDAVGKNIKIKNKSFKVVSTIAPIGQVSFFNVDDMVLLPYTTAQTYLLGIDHFHEVIVMARSAELVDATVVDIKRTLREMHNITDPSKDDFFVITQEGVVNQIKTIVGALTIFLSVVVAISLVVGGIGIMNIMFVSVTERTREIGLRKAMGATKKDIMFQFLIESVMLTGIGGLIGIILGAGFSYIGSIGLGRAMGTTVIFTFPLRAAILGISVSAFVGLVFGLYPARKAANKDAIEALRYE